MVLHKVSLVLLLVFGVKRRSDIIIRPMIMLTMISALNLLVKSQFTEFGDSNWIVETAIANLVALPFVAMCFTLLVYQSREHQSLSDAAKTDELTGLPNRRAFFKRTKDALRNNASGFFMIIDADRFKRINDTLGHPSGDVCLQAVSDRIRGLLRENDLIGRIGGEEFGVLLFDRSQEELQRFAGRLCFPISVNIQGHRELLHITVSAGSTEIGTDDTVANLTHRADEALIAAKNNGRERMVLWRPLPRAA